MAEVVTKREKKEATDPAVLQKYNDEQYKEKNIKEKIQYKIMSGEKTKIIEAITYKNGAVKRKIVGLLKGQKVLYDRGIDKKQFGIK